MFQLFLCTVIFLVLSQANNPDVLEEKTKQRMQTVEVCAKESGAGQNDLQQVLAKLPPTTREANCFLFCLQKNNKFQHASGKVNVAAIYDWVESLAPFDADYTKNLKEITRKCADYVDDLKDGCDVASELFLCFFNGCKELGIDFP